MAERKRRTVKYFYNDDCCAEILKSKKNFKKTKDPITALTPELVGMLQKLVDSYSQKTQWRNYTFVDDMKQEALLQLLRGALKFDPEAKTRSGKPNPLGYYTTICTHAFINVINREKKHSDIKDDLLEEAGMTPSWKRQCQNDPSLKDTARYSKPDDSDLIK